MTDVAGRSGELCMSVMDALEQKKPWMLSSLAQKFGVSERDVAAVLPEDRCAFTSGAHFISVWEGLKAWERATFIMQLEGHVMEVKGRIPAGTPGRGYYNLAGQEALSGHIRADAVAEIAFLSMPFMGLESHSVQFFNNRGDVVFSVYAGRENHNILPSVRASFFRLRREMTGR